MNNLPIQTYESVVQQRDALVAENMAFKLAFEKPQAYLSWHAIPPTWEDHLPCGEYLDVHDTAGHKNSDGTDCWPVFVKPDIETPTTDAFTREMMAKGVDAFAAKYTNMIKTMHPDTIAYGALKQEFESVIKEANKFAAELRKGINDAQ
ncbi:hypothetical protein [Hafnia paralvei]|uniref:hypothetical protein n=1 Tax=Hafnia paralvei TaxID=546367 RepID=UPI0024B8EF57|nr:hypothetical protein [Hafnia paralvei]